MIGKAEHHRRVEPQHRPLDLRQSEHLVEQALQTSLPLGLVPPMRHARADGGYLVGGEAMKLEIGQGMVARDPFLEDEDRPFQRETRHQMLGTL